jgi:hypothetical protein
VGWDIHAVVEVRLPWMEEEAVWSDILNASLLLDREYDAFGCLFGFVNHAHFAPIADGRGLPDDASERVRADAAEYAALDPETGFAMPSWVTWAELERVDWDELALHPDSRVHEYVRDERGEWVYETKATWSARFAAVVEQDIEASLFGPYPVWPEGAEWEGDGRLFRAERLRRRDALGEGWWSLFAIMRELARRFTADGVRLVVWFYF